MTQSSSKGIPMKQSTYLSFLMAGLLAAAGAQAQTASASGSSDAPLKAGEASTQTQGQPNAKTTNSPVGDAAAMPVPKDTQSMGAAAATSSVPAKPGEASTYVQGKPNADTMAPHALTRAEVVGELMSRRAWYESQKGIHHRGTKAPA